MKPWIRRLVLIGVGIGTAGIALLFLAANVFFQPERLVRKIEKRLNCRAAIGSVDLSLFSQPARLVIHDLALGERDDQARNQIPLADRPPLENPQVTAKKLSLAVSFFHLLVGRIHVQELVGTEVAATMIKPEEGDDSLEILFDKPDRKPKAEGDGDDEEREGKKDDEDEEDDDTIDRLKVPATMRSARLEDFKLVMELVEKKTRITWHEVDVDLTNVAISPGNLEEANHADIALNARVAFDHREKDRHYGKMVLRGAGSIKPVDPKTRKIEPEVQFQIDVLPESSIETAPLLDAVVEKLGDLEKYGISLENVKLAGNLAQQASLKGRYKDHLFVLAEDAVFDFGNYQLALGRDSWYESEDNFHEFHSKLTAGPVITDGVLGSVDKYIGKKVRFLPPDTFKRLIGDHFLEDGRFTLKLVTKGDIGQPKVAFSDQLPDIDIKAVKDSAEGLIKDLRSIFR